MLYALELETASGILMVARPAPSEGRGTSTQMHVSYRNRDAGPPEAGEFVLNSNVESAIAVLSTALGIDDNITDTGSRRVTFDATIRHALFFCIQSQGEIANQNILFHSQGEEHLPQAIRDVLPYFVGTIDPEFVVKRELLRLRQRELRELERRVSDELALSRAPGRASALLAEAVALGLAVAPAELTRVSVVEALSSVLQAEVELAPPADRTNEMAELLSARELLRSDFSATRADLRRFRKLARYEDEFADEAGERRSRLQSLHLLRLEPASDETAVDTCPLCSSILADPVTTVAEIRQHLIRASRDIADVNSDRPRVQTTISALEGRQSELAAALLANQQALDAVSESIEMLESIREISLQRAAVRGRISLFLDSVSHETEVAFVGDRIRELELEVDALTRELDADAAAERLAAALSRISYEISSVAATLQLEHAPAPVRLDARALTVIVDTANGSYKLREIGSGANWLGYHLSTLIGLHSFFTENSRPVPNFLLLDQPSQVYFPPDASGLELLSDDDHAALSRLFDVLFRFVAESAAGFQILVLEHADLADDRFANSVVERWRLDGQALIPTDWMY